MKRSTLFGHGYSCKYCGMKIPSGIFNAIKHNQECHPIERAVLDEEMIDKELDKIIKDISKERKGSGEHSYETNGVVEKVVTNGYTSWQPHGTLDKYMKEALEEDIRKFELEKQKNELNPTFIRESRRERRANKRKK